MMSVDLRVKRGFSSLLGSLLSQKTGQTRQTDKRERKSFSSLSCLASLIESTSNFSLGKFYCEKQK
jgi:hypothetical protein